MMEKSFLCFGILLVCSNYINGLIVPEELPTILSLIYSNIPPIRKGTDSRLGVGFRLGQHADAQVLLEIGPQKETEPLSSAESKKRRQIMLNAAMRGDFGPWTKSIAKFNMDKIKHKQVYKEDKQTEVINEKNSSDNWLAKWSKEMSNPNEEEKFPGVPKVQKIRMATKLQ